MNGDPYARSQQAADRRVINRAGTPAGATRPVEEPQPLNADVPRTLPRSAAARADHDDRRPRSRKGLTWTILVIVAVVVLLGAAWFVFGNKKAGDTGIDTGKYQAVFLSNGQVYFGKLSDFNDSSYKLTHIYYPQAQSDSTDKKDTTATNPSSGIKLIRLGDEVHGPENEMFITKSQTLYYENLKSDSKVSGLIDQNEKNR